MREIAALALVAVLSAGAPCSSGAELVLRDVRIVDVVRGRVVPGQAVVVSGDRIRWVGTDARVRPAPDATVVAGAGRWVIPGLWDLHTHALWDSIALETFVPAMVAHGITGFRDMGGRLELLARARREAAAGGAWPRIVASGPWLDGPVPVDPNVGLGIGSPAEGRRAVDSLARGGVDFIKVYTLLDREPFRAVLDQARRHRLRVAGHVPHDVTSLEAAQWGMHSIEHLRGETGGLCAGLSDGACDSVLKAFRRFGTWQTPTLLARRARARAADSTLGTGPGFEYVPATLRAEWEATRRTKLATRPPSYFEGLAAEHRTEVGMAGRVWGAGIPILAGSDCGADFTPPGIGLHDELALLVEAGLGPADALRAATSEAARFLGRARTSGQIAAGFDADLVLLDADPLADIRATRRIAGVVLRGRWMGPAALDSLSRRAAEVAARN